MSSSLLPERPLLISPTLASTIGLEETVMLQVLGELISHGQAQPRPQRSDIKWIELSHEDLLHAFPFWATVDIKRVQLSLQNLGLILIDPDTGSSSSYYFAIDEVSTVATPAVKTKPAAMPGDVGGGGPGTLIPPNWQPDENWIRQCKQHNIPAQFIQGLVLEFVSYWRERGQARFSWGNAFYKHVIKEWRNEQTRQGAYELASTMSADWLPSPDALGIMENAGINPSFIEDAIPEFVLYWRERGALNGAWNTKFIEHIRRQWAKFSAAFGYDDTPKLIPADWQPSADCFEILQLAEIDEGYARSKIPEFVLYWKDSNQVKTSWDTVFLQFVKQDWARQLKLEQAQEFENETHQFTSGSTKEKVRAKLEKLADRSWAE